MPVYGLALNLAQLVVLSYGIYLIGAGQLTVGLLIGFLLYVNSFYLPLRQVAMLWSSLQLALAALDRISEVLALQSNMPVVASNGQPKSGGSIGIQQRSLQLSGRNRGPEGNELHLGKRQDLCACWSYRRRQDDDCIAHGASLRSNRRRSSP